MFPSFRGCWKGIFIYCVLLYICSLDLRVRQLHGGESRSASCQNEELDPGDWAHKHELYCPDYLQAWSVSSVLCSWFQPIVVLLFINILQKASSHIIKWVFDALSIFQIPKRIHCLLLHQPPFLNSFHSLTVLHECSSILAGVQELEFISKSSYLAHVWKTFCSL